MRLALFEPDIPQNAASLIRLAACMDIAIDVIEPCGFLFTDKGFRRAGMDYLDAAKVIRHSGWAEFAAAMRGRRIILVTSRGDTRYDKFGFTADDVLLLGRESAGVPQFVHDAVQARLRIPMKPAMRSLNVAQAGAMVLGEALRQTKSFPA